MDQLFHVIRLVRVRRDQRVQAVIHAKRIVKEWPDRRFLAIVEGQKIHQTPYFCQGLNVILKGPIGHG